MTGLDTILAVLLVAWFVLSMIVRIKDAGHRRCAYCGAVLKFMPGAAPGVSHALVCRRCGRTQPWA